MKNAIIITFIIGLLAGAALAAMIVKAFLLHPVMVIMGSIAIILTIVMLFYLYFKK